MAMHMRATVELARWWWTFILRGLLAIAFGVLVFVSPGMGIAVLVGLFAAWALIDGAALLIAGFQTRASDRNWWLAILEGLAGVAAAVIALIAPTYAATVLVLLIAAWAIVTGVIEIVAAVRLREQIRGELWLGLAGLLSVLVGIGMFFFPAAGALSILWLIGAFAVVFGIFLVGLGWRLRHVNELAKIDAAHDYSR
jgi:uncharacterized membrane protein HdeD (DUF308 family)